jgi:outer membrane murein-binding lipoprotein Lpp
MKTTIIFTTAMYSVLTGLIIAVQYQLFRNREKSRERDLNTQVSELTAGIDQRNEEIQRLSSSVIDQDAKIQRLIHERSDAIQAAGFAKAEIESANIRIAVLSERENMLQSELTAFADLLDRYRREAVSNIELVERVLGVGVVQGERGIEPEPETDWSKVPFPDGYVVPKGIEVVVISETRNEDSPRHRKPGLKGITTEKDDVPCCDWEDGRKNIYMRSDELAPVNPTDHPNHPEFGK